MCDSLQLNWKLPSAGLSGNNKSEKKKKSSVGKKKGAGKRKASASKDDDKYTLRACSIQKRIDTESRKKQPKKRGPKPRPKPQPMSKYRRKTANLRERERMGDINVAFEYLRGKIPSPAITGKGRCEKMTKINILHVAITYIRALENILDHGEAGVNEYGTACIQSPNLPLAFPGEDNPIGMDEPVLAVSAKVKKIAKKICARKIKVLKYGTQPLPEDRDDPNQLILFSSKGSPARSASEDSGIMEDGDESEDGDEAMDVPDWTELVSTLEFPSPSSVISSASSSPSSSGGSCSVYTPNGSDFHLEDPPTSPSDMIQALMPLFPLPPMSKRGDLDTLLTSSAAPSASESRRPPSEVLRVLQPSCKAPINRQISFPDLNSEGGEDLFGVGLDPSGIAESLEGLGDINFSHEDPFQLLIMS